MKAIVLTGFGGVENLVIREIPAPVPADGEVLVQVKAISTNPVDAKTRAGKGAANQLKDENPIILGWDISGVVTESKSPLFKVGDEVFGMVNFPGHGRAYAEYVAAPADQLATKPVAISHAEAAAASLAALTAWQALTTHGQVQAGQRVLVHAASGGVGHFAVQIAKELGAYVIGTSSSENKEFVLSLGANEHIDYKAQPLAQATHDIDFVLDAIGGDTIDQSLEVMKPGGLIISIPSGKNEAVSDKATANGMNGRVMRVQSNGADMKQLADRLENGRLKAHVSQRYSFDEIWEAHLQQESGRTVGKLVIEL